MAGYWIALVEVDDPDAYRAYAEAGTQAIQRFGGRFLARGGRRVTLEGPEAPGRVVVTEFPSFQQAIDCYRSAEYQRARELRKGAARAQIVIVESA